MSISIETRQDLDQLPAIDHFEVAVAKARTRLFATIVRDAELRAHGQHAKADSLEYAWMNAKRRLEEAAGGRGVITDRANYEAGVEFERITREHAKTGYCSTCSLCQEPTWDALAG